MEHEFVQKKSCYPIAKFINSEQYMKVNKIDVGKALANAKNLLLKEKGISKPLCTALELIFMLVEILVERLSLNSNNSSKPPSSDPNRKKQPRKKKSNKKPGGQPGHKGSQLKPVDNPDEIENIKLDKRKLPKDIYREAGYESRQLFNINVTLKVTEYRAQILIGSNGNRYVADFPAHINRPAQYGSSVKTQAVYLSQHQLMPYNRVEDYFHDQIGLGISAGTVYNFNREAYERLEQFETITINKLIASKRLNVDETGIKINGSRLWLHTACNDKWTHFYPHAKRGHEAMDAIGIIPNFEGVLCHDHWKSYYRYDCKHALCNAHHIRELEWSATVDKQVWADKLKTFLIELNDIVSHAGGQLTDSQYQYRLGKYRKILADADQECPAPSLPNKKRKGPIKKSKSRNLLERLTKYAHDVLRFAKDKNVPFTNNQGENDLRMTKVQQKISGCFRSYDGALIFCRIRAYLITCRKHHISATDALDCLFKDKFPDFVSD